MINLAKAALKWIEPVLAEERCRVCHSFFVPNNKERMEFLNTLKSFKQNIDPNSHLANIYNKSEASAINSIKLIYKDILNKRYKAITKAQALSNLQNAATSASSYKSINSVWKDSYYEVYNKANLSSKNLCLPLLISNKVCPSCIVKMSKKVSGFCPMCGEPAASPLLKPSYCGRCIKLTPPWDNFYFWTDYTKIWRDIFVRYKFKNELYLSEIIGCMLSSYLLTTNKRYDYIIPIPLHAKRLKFRGYNQSLEIVKQIIKFYKKFSKTKLVPTCLPNALRRTTNTKPQVGLSRKEREANTKNIFSATRDFNKSHILLVDDIVTTGSTIRSATQELLDNGAASVDILTMARTSLHLDN